MCYMNVMCRNNDRTVQMTNVTIQAVYGPADTLNKLGIIEGQMSRIVPEREATPAETKGVFDDGPFT